MEECNSTFPSLVCVFLNWVRSKLMNKKTAVLGMVSMLALTACGGGGGGVSISTPKPIDNFVGSMSFKSFANDLGIISQLQTVTNDGIVTAKEAIKVFEWMKDNPINRELLKNYTVEVEGETIPLDRAWDKLNGYKKVYYDGKEDFWKSVVDEGNYEDTSNSFLDIKAFAQNEDKIDFEKVGTGEILVKDLKDIIVPIVEEPIVEEPIVEEPIVEEPIVEEPIVEEPEPIVEEPIVEEPIVEEPIVEEPIVEEPIVEEPIVEEPIVEEPIVEEPIVEEPIVEEPIVEEPIVGTYCRRAYCRGTNS